MLLVSPQCHLLSFLGVEAEMGTVISILQAETWQQGDFPKAVWPAKAKAANQMPDASGQAQLLHIWRATWVQVGKRGKEWTLGSCC